MAQIVVGDEVIVVDRATPAQVVGISHLLGRYVRSVKESIGDLSTADNLDIIAGFLMALDEEALIELGMIISNRDSDWVRANFALGWIIEGLSALVEASDLQRVLRNFTSLFSQIQG